VEKGIEGKKGRNPKGQLEQNKDTDILTKPQKIYPASGKPLIYPKINAMLTFSSNRPSYSHPLTCTHRSISARARFATILLLAPLLFFACKFPERPVTKEEALQLAHKMESTIAIRNPVLMDKIIDEDEFSHRVAESNDHTLNRSLMNGAIEGIREAHFGQQIVQALGPEGTYQLVKQYEKDNHQHILFRLFGKGAVNYHDFELIKKGEETRAADVYIYLSGENLSKTLGAALMMMQDNMKDMSKTDMDKIDKMKVIRALVARHEMTKAMAAYQELPNDFKRQKLFQLIHIQITSELGNDVYAAALDEYKSLFPNDPNMYLMMVDAYVLRKDYPKALEAVNKLDSFINKDPFQDYYRGLVYKLMADTAHSIACFQRLHTAMPSFGDATLELIVAYEKEGAPDRSAPLLAAAKADKSISTETINNLYILYPDLKSSTNTSH
jgi:tetratricopeptide (TPR) repeat protein